MTQKPERFSPMLLLEEFRLKGGNTIPGAAGGGKRVRTNGSLQGMKAVGEVLKQEEESVSCFSPSFLCHVNIGSASQEL